jgi:hypothetical protein
MVGGSLLSSALNNSGIIDNKADYVAQGGPGSLVWNPYTVGTPTIGGGWAGSSAPSNMTYAPPSGAPYDPYRAVAKNAVPVTGRMATSSAAPASGGPQLSNYMTGPGGVMGSATPDRTIGSYINGPMGTVLGSGPNTRGDNGSSSTSLPQMVGNPTPLQYGAPSSSFNASAQLNDFNARAMASNFNAQAIKNQFAAEAMRNAFQAQAYQNSFRAQQAQLDQSQYGDVIQNSLNAAGGQGGVAQDTIGQMGTLGDALRAQMAGTGPSLAQLQLQEATDRNMSQMSGAIAAQRGINPGLANRAILNQGAAAQQASVNQSAQIRMAEQLAAQQQLAALLQNQGGLQIGQQQAGTQALGTAGGLQNEQNAARISNLMQSQGLDLNAILANQQAQMGAQQINWQSSSQNADLAQAAQAINAGVASQNADLANSAQQMNWGTANNNAQLAQAAQALNAQVSMGNQEAKNYAMGLNQQTSSLNANLGNSTNQINAGLATEQARLAMAAQQMQADIANGNAQRGLGVEQLRLQKSISNAGSAQQSQGQIMGMIGQGMASGASMPWARGGQIPGKAPFPGRDTPKNDVVKGALTPGEVVLPLSVTQAPDAPVRAYAFMRAIQENKKLPIYQRMVDRKAAASKQQKRPQQKAPQRPQQKPQPAR